MPQALDIAWLRQNLPPRPKTGHKGTFGTVMLVAGSRRYRGAAVLATAAALRTGTGLVRLASIEAVCAAAAACLPACTLLPLAESTQGGIAADALPLLVAESASAVVVGCGLGATADTSTLVRGFLRAPGGPLLLDADALNTLAGVVDDQVALRQREEHLALLAKAPRPVVITPHIGEMARLTGRPAAEIEVSQQQAAADFAQSFRCTVVLKSHATIVASPKGSCYKLDFGGNSGLAKGGSGDVLAGIIGGLLAQDIPCDTAAAAGVTLHALAAEAASAQYGETGLSSADLPDALGGVWRALDR